MFWCICNISVGYTIVYLFTSGQGQVIFYIGVFLTSVLVFRILFSTIHTIKAKCDRFRVKKLMGGKVSTVFNMLEKDPDAGKEDVFDIYYDECGNSALLPKSDPRLKMSRAPSSIMAHNVYRGFSLSNINKKHQISQYGYGDPVSAKGVKRFSENIEHFFEEEEDSDDEDDDEIEEEDVDLGSDSSIDEGYNNTNNPALMKPKALTNPSESNGSKMNVPSPQKLSVISP